MSSHDNFSVATKFSKKNQSSLYHLLTMPSSITDPFVVTSLPRVSATASPLDVCQIPVLKSANSSTFDMAISGSYLGTFITRPSPRMIWSYALSPQTIVHALDSHSFEETESSFEKKCIALALSERKKHSLRFISYGKQSSQPNDVSEASDDDSVAADDSVAVSNEDDTNTVETEQLKEVQAIEVPLSHEIIDLRLGNDGQHLYALGANGEVSLWEFGNKTPLLKEQLPRFTRHTKIVFSTFVDPSQLELKAAQLVESVVVFIESSGTELTCRIIAITKDSVLEISSAKLPLQGEYSYSYDPVGQLVALEKESTELHVFSLPYVKEERTFNASSVFSAEPDASTSSILAVAPHRVFVSKGSTIALIDTLHEAILATLDIYPRSKQNSAKAPREVTLMQCCQVRGNSMKTTETFALVFVKNVKENYAHLNYVSADVGLGRLRDVLGKGLKPERKNKFVGLPVLATKPELQSTVKEVAGLNKRSAEGSKKLEKVFRQFAKLHKDGKWDDLEKYIVAFLKMDPEADLAKGYTGTEETGEFRVFEVDKDRIVDPFFIKKTTQLLFDRQDGLALPEHVSERALTYLLTHPLFPKELTPGLLHVLEPAPQLLRQAIVTCPNVPCGDLIEQLSFVDSEEIFRDLVARIVDEFSSERITQETIRLLSSQTEYTEGNVDLDRIIQKILKLNYGYEILNSLIDSNGLALSLHYSKNQTQLTKLMDKIQGQIDSLMTDSQLVSLVDKTLVVADSEAKKNRKKKTKTLIETDTGNLEAVLRMPGDEKKKQIASYSIERLTI